MNQQYSLVAVGEARGGDSAPTPRRRRKVRGVVHCCKALFGRLVRLPSAARRDTHARVAQLVPATTDDDGRRLRGRLDSEARVFIENVARLRNKCSQTCLSRSADTCVRYHREPQMANGWME